jgi:hypothetical protein
MYGHSDVTVHELSHNGHPYVEIRRNGASFFDGDGPKKKFQFGLYKACMLLTCKELIEDFAYTEGGKPPSNLEYCINDGPYVPVCSSIKYDEFATSYGIIVAKPYLKIESGWRNIGLGVQKAKSFLEVVPEIEAFVARNR